MLNERDGTERSKRPGKTRPVEARPCGPRQLLGRQGEDLAATALEAAGLQIVARNVRTRLGELDMVARDGRFLVFVEVKTRRGDRFGTGADAVGRRKQDRLRRLAAAYLGRAVESTPIRFDVVDVAIKSGMEPDVRHIRGAF